MPDLFISDLITNPATPGELESNVRYARVIVARQLNLSSIAGTPEQYAQLSQVEQIKLIDELSVFIAAHPENFSPAQVVIAQRRIGSGSFRSPVADTSFTAAAGEFVGELAGTVEKRIVMLLTVAVIAGLAFLILPGAIAKARAAVGK